MDNSTILHRYFSFSLPLASVRNSSSSSSVAAAALESPTYTQLENAAMSNFNKPIIPMSQQQQQQQPLQLPPALPPPPPSSYGIYNPSTSLALKPEASAPPPLPPAAPSDTAGSIYNLKSRQPPPPPPPHHHQLLPTVPAPPNIYDPSGNVYCDLKPDQPPPTWSNNPPISYGENGRRLLNSFRLSYLYCEIL